ncbi:MAG: hypothetical protein QF449_11950 [Alphaproteobacteria bacterium]|jgi:hypothetical protein|nr:hypothetical protein [Alphaproteobacteria bacterium]MDP6818739.1 hypothetical protein [Alphaproteobacteria bacterium]
MLPAIIAAIAPHLIDIIAADDKKEGDLKNQISAVLSDVLGGGELTDANTVISALRADPEKLIRAQERLEVLRAQAEAREAKSMAEARAANLEQSKQMRGMAFVPAFLAVISLAALMYVIHQILNGPPENREITYGILGFVAPLTYAAFNHILGSSIGSKIKTMINGAGGRR